MSYPIKDKSKVTQIKESFEVEKYNLLTKDYLEIITPLRKVTISDMVKAKIKDDFFGKKKAFESMSCNHKEKNEFSLATCERCQYNIREIEAENIINSLTGNEQTIDKDPLGMPITRSLTKFTVIRGRLNDVVGYRWEWQ